MKTHQTFRALCDSKAVLFLSWPTFLRSVWLWWIYLIHKWKFSHLTSRWNELYLEATAFFVFFAYLQNSICYHWENNLDANFENSEENATTLSPKRLCPFSRIYNSCSRQIRWCNCNNASNILLYEHTQKFKKEVWKSHFERSTKRSQSSVFIMLK